MKPFLHSSQAQRVVFGAGSLAQLGEEIERLGATRALVLSTPQQRRDTERLAESIGTPAVGVFDGAAMHVPLQVARDAREQAR